jgi:hypothetical protein
MEDRGWKIEDRGIDTTSLVFLHPLSSILYPLSPLSPCLRG